MATENILTKFITAQQEDFNMALSETNSFVGSLMKKREKFLFNPS